MTQRLASRQFAPSPMASIVGPRTKLSPLRPVGPSAPRERLALALLLYTGQRRGDVIHMGRQHISKAPSK